MDEYEEWRCRVCGHTQRFTGADIRRYGGERDDLVRYCPSCTAWTDHAAGGRVVLNEPRSPRHPTP